jgi:hypothetical protein
MNMTSSANILEKAVDEDHDSTLVHDKNDNDDTLEALETMSTLSDEFFDAVCKCHFSPTVLHEIK